MTGVLSNWRGYLELTKPGVQALLFVSCASGMLIGSDFNPPIEVFFFGLIGILLGFMYIQIKNPVYESNLNIEIENVPPFYLEVDIASATSIKKTTFDFKKNVLSRTNFNNWKSNSKKNSLAFDSFSETIIVSAKY